MKITEIDAKSIITKSNLPLGGFSANPYVGCTHKCKYCYASFMKRFTNHPEPWGEFLDVKYWPAINNTKKYAGENIFIGSVTDAYNPQEEIYGRTRELLLQLKDSGAHINISTKSDLILRDLDILKTIPDVTIAWSINTLDEDFKNDMDDAVSIERRLTAMKTFYDAGIRTVCFISPIFPGITSLPAIVEKVMKQCNMIWLENLNLRGSFKSCILNYIKEKHPELQALYNDIYQNGDRQYWQTLDLKMKNYCSRLGLRYLRNDSTDSQLFNVPPIVINYFYHEEIRQQAKK